MSHYTIKSTICICKNKKQTSCAVIAQLISVFVFATQIVQCLFFLNMKFKTSSLLLGLYRLVHVRPDRKRKCWFSHVKAQIIINESEYMTNFDIIPSNLFCSCCERQLVCTRQCCKPGLGLNTYPSLSESPKNKGPKLFNNFQKYTWQNAEAQHQVRQL